MDGARLKQELTGFDDRWGYVHCILRKCAGKWIMLGGDITYWAGVVERCQSYTAVNGGRTALSDFLGGNYSEEECKAFAETVSAVQTGAEDALLPRHVEILRETFSCPMKANPAVVLIAAGSDSSGGAGIQADLKACEALGVYGMTAITALTSQNTKGVAAVNLPPTEFIASQLDVSHTDIPAGVIKTGMLPDPDTVAAISTYARTHAIPLIVDPVMVSTSGCKLAGTPVVASIVEHMLPICTLVTPNLPEAAVLIGKEGTPLGDLCPTLEAVIAVAKQVQSTTGAKNVLLKGGHLNEVPGFAACHDVLLLGDAEPEVLTTPWVDTTNTHGTGCTLASSISAGVAKGLPLREAVGQAKAYLTMVLKMSQGVKMGKGGCGPMVHSPFTW